MLEDNPAKTLVQSEDLQEKAMLTFIAEQLHYTKLNLNDPKLVEVFGEDFIESIKAVKIPRKRWRKELWSRLLTTAFNTKGKDAAKAKGDMNLGGYALGQIFVGMSIFEGIAEDEDLREDFDLSPEGAEKSKQARSNIRQNLASIDTEGGWEVIPEAFTYHENNLRKHDLEQLYSPAGLSEAWRYLENYPALQNVLNEEDDDRNLENIILTLVTYRNDATHRKPDDILSIDELRKWVRYVEVICEGLTSYVRHELLKASRKKNPEIVVGKVSEIFSDNVSVFRSDSGTFNVNDEFYALRPDVHQKVKLLSIQRDDVDVKSFEVTEANTEIGIKTDYPVKKNSDLIFLDSRLAQIVD